MVVYGCHGVRARVRVVAAGAVGRVADRVAAVRVAGRVVDNGRPGSMVDLRDGMPPVPMVGVYPIAKRQPIA